MPAGAASQPCAIHPKSGSRVVKRDREAPQRRRARSWLRSTTTFAPRRRASSRAASTRATSSAPAVTASTIARSSSASLGSAPRAVTAGCDSSRAVSSRGASIAVPHARSPAFFRRSSVLARSASIPVGVAPASGAQERARRRANGHLSFLYSSSGWARVSASWSAPPDSYRKEQFPLGSPRRTRWGCRLPFPRRMPRRARCWWTSPPTARPQHLPRAWLLALALVVRACALNADRVRRRLIRAVAVAGRQRRDGLLVPRPPVYVDGVVRAKASSGARHARS